MPILTCERSTHMNILARGLGIRHRVVYMVWISFWTIGSIGVTVCTKMASPKNLWSMFKWQMPGPIYKCMDGRDEVGWKEWTKIKMLNHTLQDCGRWIRNSLTCNTKLCVTHTHNFWYLVLGGASNINTKVIAIFLAREIPVLNQTNCCVRNGHQMHHMHRRFPHLCKVKMYMMIRETNIGQQLHNVLTWLIIVTKSEITSYIIVWILEKLWPVYLMCLC